MKRFSFCASVWLAAALMACVALGQSKPCPTGDCPQQSIRWYTQPQPVVQSRPLVQVAPTIQTQPVRTPASEPPNLDALFNAPVGQVDVRKLIELQPLGGQYDQLCVTETAYELRDETDFERVVRATVRVTVSGVCGSGTIVGKFNDKKVILTNAHVAGTQKGRVVDVERWNFDGSSEKGKARIVASGYGRGTSMDWALLESQIGWAEDVVPIPLADRYPDQAAGITTYGAPRCEWPSLQVLRMTQNEGQVLRWFPLAIGGRSGSSLIDYTDVGPRVVGLLTWGNGREGLGQSTPFLLDAIRGRVQTSVELLPPDAVELAAPAPPEDEFCILPWYTDVTESLQPANRRLAMGLMQQEWEPADGGIIDSILEPTPAPEQPPVKPESPVAPVDPQQPDDEQREMPIREAFVELIKGIFRFIRGSLIGLFMFAAGVLIGALGRNILARMLGRGGA